MNITIRDYKKFDGSGKVKGSASIQVNVDGFPLTINNIRVIEGEKGQFFAMPQKSYQDKSGETKHVSLCGFFTKEGYQDFQDSMKKAFSIYFSNNPMQQNAPQQQYQPVQQQYQPAQPAQSVFNNQQQNELPF